ncbi:MAG: DNA-3-methyladenine glycosylase I [Plesiomonas shigelloides]
MQRCNWVSDDPLYLAYHDQEWGRPLYDGDRLFELLCLEGQQAGLSWITVLKKRAHYRHCFFGFAAGRMAALSEAQLAGLMQDSGLIRNRRKLAALVQNARAYLALQAQGEDFSTLLWSFVGGQPQINHFASAEQVPASTPASVAMSKALKKRGFTFVGPTICYAFMQAAGLVNDHLTCCDWHARCNGAHFTDKDDNR